MLEKESTMAKIETMNEKSLNKMVENAIKSDLNNATVLLETAVHCAMFAAGEAGRTDPLSKLFNGITQASAASVRQFFVNLTAKYGLEETNEAGKTRKVNYLVYSTANKRFEHVKSDAGKAMRGIIASLPFDEIKAVGMDKPKDDRGSDFNKAFDSWDVLKKAITRIAQNDPAFENILVTIQNVSGMPKAYQVDVHAAARKVKEDVEKLEKQLAEKKALLAKRDAQANPANDADNEGNEAEKLKVA
jgi:hypothetical protein